MSGLINKIFLVIAVIIIYFIVVSIPQLNKIIGCYDRNVDIFESIEYKTRSQGYNEEKRCEMRQGAVLDLENCLKSSVMKSNLPIDLYSVTLKVIPFIRPGSQDMPALKATHDRDCQKFSRYMFNPAN